MSRSIRTRAVRLGASFAAAALAVALAPAGRSYAADPASFAVSILGSDIKVGSDGDGKVVFVGATAANAVNPVLTVDMSGLGKFATLIPLDDDACKTAGTKITCKLPDGTYDSLWVPFTLKAAAGAKLGETGTFSVSAQADNTPFPTGGSAKVTIADGVDLVAVDESEGVKAAKPGDVVWMPGTFFNEGNRAAADAAFTFWFDNGLVPEQYDGCTYSDWAFGIQVTCPVGELAPGEGVTFITEDGTPGGHPGMAVKVGADALGDKVGQFYADPGAGDSPQSLAKHSKKASGGKHFSAKAEQKPPKDLNDNDNFAVYFWRVPNTKDVASSGATASGKVGDVVKINIGIKNVGKTTIDVSHTGGDSSWWYDFVVPDGTEVVSVPEHCTAWWHEADGDHAAKQQPGKRFYECYNYDQLFSPGETSTAQFGLKITQVIANSTGTVSFTNQFRTPAERTDDNAPNDLAEVVINPGSGNGGGGGGGLPVTGAQTGLVAGVGAVLLIGGAVLFMLARRRRVVLVTPQDGGAE